MSKGVEAVRDVGSFLALSDREADALAEEIVRSLGPTWKVCQRAGKARIVLLHAPTDLRFVFVPGGTMRMGISDEDLIEVRRVLDGDPDDPAVERASRQARPVHEVAVRPFLCTIRLLTSAETRRLSGGALRSDTVKRAQAIRMAEEHGLRLPSEAELEWLARDGRGAATLLDAANHHEESDDEGDLPSRFSVRDVLRTAWARDDWHDDYTGAKASSEAWLEGDPAGVCRGGLLLPVIDREELWTGLSGLRRRGLETDEDGKECVPDCMVRLAHDLPS